MPLNPDRLARFQREAQVLASLNHSGIAAIYGRVARTRELYAAVPDRTPEEPTSGRTTGTLSILVSILTVAVPSYSQPSVAPPQPTDTFQGDPRRGATEFTACINCHGRNAEGEFAPDLAGTGLGWTAFRRAVRQAWGIMPAFREQQKPDQALADIHAYLKTLPPTVALGEWHWRKAPETAPLGQRLYMNFAGCGQCHEPEGKFPRARLGKFARGRHIRLFQATDLSTLRKVAERHHAALFP